MTGLTTLKALTLITKLYTGYAYSLAFLFQSSLVLIMAAVATVGYIWIKDKSYSLLTKHNSFDQSRPSIKPDH